MMTSTSRNCRKIKNSDFILTQMLSQWALLWLPPDSSPLYSEN